MSVLDFEDFKAEGLTHVYVLHLWDPSIVKLLRQRNFPQGTELGGVSSSDTVNLSMLRVHATDLS